MRILSLKKCQAIIVTTFALLIACLATIFAPSAYADIAPEPSTTLEFENFGTKLYFFAVYVSPGHEDIYAPYKKGEQQIMESPSTNCSIKTKEDVENFFANYDDPDNYYYDGRYVYNPLNEPGKFGYEPDKFKVVFYFPNDNTMAVSDILKRKYFDSKYVLSYDGNINSKEVKIIAKDDSSNAEPVETEDFIQQPSDESNFSSNVIHLGIKSDASMPKFLARMVVTILIELLIALLFRFKKRSFILYIIGFNVLTQILLNIILYGSAAIYGSSSYNASIIVGEFLVIAIECVAYYMYLIKNKDTYSCKPAMGVIYGITANAVSYIAGLLLVRFLPGIF